MIQLTGDVPELFADLVNVLRGIRDTFEENSLPKELAEEIAVLAAKVAFSPCEMQDEFFSSLRKFRGRLETRAGNPNPLGLG